MKSQVHVDSDQGVTFWFDVRLESSADVRVSLNEARETNDGKLLSRDECWKLCSEEERKRVISLACKQAAEAVLKAR